MLRIEEMRSCQLLMIVVLLPFAVWDLLVGRLLFKRIKARRRWSDLFIPVILSACATAFVVVAAIHVHFHKAFGKINVVLLTISVLLFCVALIIIITYRTQFAELCGRGKVPPTYVRLILIFGLSLAASGLVRVILYIVPL